MRNEKFYAVGMMVAMMARNKAHDESTTANEIIALTPLLKNWAEGVFYKGDVRVYENAPYRCVQDHNSTGNPSWNPKDAKSLWANFHATIAMYAMPYVAPTGAHDCYNSGEYMIWEDGKVYLCTVNATVYGPDVLAANWAVQE